MGLADFLNGAPGQTPVQPQTNGELGSLINPQPSAAPGNPFSGAGDWLQAHPGIGQALLHTFIGLAQGNSLGEATANGGRAFAFSQAQAKADETAGQTRQDKLNQQEAVNKQNDQRLSISQQNADTSKTTADANAAIAQELAPERKKLLGAQAGKVSAESDQLRTMLQPKLDMLNAEKARLMAQVATSTDALKTAALNRQILDLDRQGKALELTLNSTYKPMMLDAQVTGAQLKNAGQVSANQMADEKLGILQSLSPMQKQQLLLGVKTAKTPQELWLTFAAKASPWFTDPKTGQVDTDKLMQLWTVANDPKFLSGQVTQMPQPALAPEEKAKWDTARNAVPVGAKYRGPDGQIYIRQK